jgi:hypothetical protein
MPALPGSHYCKAHQGNHSHYATSNCELCTALAEVERLRAMIASAFAVLYDAPELNPSNYSHDDVCRLNAAACEAHAILGTPNTPDGQRAE